MSQQHACWAVNRFSNILMLLRQHPFSIGMKCGARQYTCGVLFHSDRWAKLDQILNFWGSHFHSHLFYWSGKISRAWVNLWYAFVTNFSLIGMHCLSCAAKTRDTNLTNFWICMARILTFTDHCQLWHSNLFLIISPWSVNPVAPGANNCRETTNLTKFEFWGFDGPDLWRDGWISTCSTIGAKLAWESEAVVPLVRPTVSHCSSCEQ